MRASVTDLFPFPAARSLELSDGRRLVYAEYGEFDGTPLLFFHGTPGSRRVARWADAAARRRGVRLIAPDRPGFGLSDPQPGRTLGDWPADVAELADALGLGRFAVAGVSGGGPYVAACAWRMPDRLTGAGIISGMGPLDDPTLAAALPRRYRAAFGLARRGAAPGRGSARHRRPGPAPGTRTRAGQGRRLAPRGRPRDLPPTRGAGPAAR